MWKEKSEIKNSIKMVYEMEEEVDTIQNGGFTKGTSRHNSEFISNKSVSLEEFYGTRKNQKFK